MCTDLNFVRIQPLDQLLGFIQNDPLQTPFAEPKISQVAQTEATLLHPERAVGKEEPCKRAQVLWRVELLERSNLCSQLTNKHYYVTR